jgi:ParB family transcriptional regulator, chromosome partitioning protein
MDALATECLEVDLHRLELRFASARLIEPRAVESLARSIERCGQLIACIVVPEIGGERLVLIDGYRRVAALRRLGRDTACVERWGCDLAHALISVLARAHGRAFASIEEALLVRELVHGFGLSQHEVARRSGRDVSWVSRRLQLLCGLPDATLTAVREGRLSSWAATRVLAPLARANAEHAEQLMNALRQAPLSTRELQRWFEHYQGAQRATRERLVAHPRLFLEALHARDEQCALERLRAGPEGECLAELQRIAALITRLRKRLPTLCPLPQALVSALERLQAALEALHSDLNRYSGHDPHRDPQQRAHPPGTRSDSARDQPPAPALA